MTQTATRRYKATESKYKGGAQEMYVTYDLSQKTRGGDRALYPKVKRVYIAGNVTNWETGTFKKRSGKNVHGVKIEYEQSRAGYTRKGYTAHRGGREYHVPTTTVEGGRSHFAQIVEVPEGAQNVQFHAGSLPQRYREALQDIR
jgi:hypothetical protein